LAYLSKGDTRAAEKEAREAIKLSPQSPIFYATLGRVLNHQDRFIEAKSAYERAIELNPEYALGHHYLGLLLYSDLNLSGEGERKFRAAISFAPKFAQAHTYLGLTLLEDEAFDEAGDELEEALELDPDFR
jgi:tetratricopeptide (TPR) repeat protein